MKFDLPAERTLPDKQTHLEEVLGGNDAHAGSRRPGSRARRRSPGARWLAPVAASVTAAALVVSAVAVTGLVERGNDRAGDRVAADGTAPGGGDADGHGAGSSGAPAAASSGPADVELWVEALTPVRAAELATECASGIGSGSSTIDPEEVLSAQVQRRLDQSKGRIAVVVAEDSTTAERIGCELWLRADGHATVGSAAQMGGPGSKSTVNHHDETHPAIPTDGPGGYQVGTRTVQQSATYEVDQRVASMRARYVVDGESGPWFVAPAVDGWVYLQSAVDARDLAGASSLLLQTEVLDDAGRRLDAPGDQVGGGGISPSPGKTRRDDLGDLLCTTGATDPVASLCGVG